MRRLFWAVARLIAPGWVMRRAVRKHFEAAALFRELARRVEAQMREAK